MYNKREINLLPQEIKSKYLKKTLIVLLAGAGGIIAAGILIQLMLIMVLNFQIKGIRKANDKYNTTKQEIAEIQNNIEEYKNLITCYESEYFPFSQFMYDMASLTPEDVRIISADSRDRLVNEGEHEDEDENIKSDANTEKEESKESSEDEQTAEDETAPAELPDLAGNEIVIRGFGATQDGISKFIYGLSNLKYIKELNVTAIEEHRIENGIYNIFEITVIGG